MDLEPVLRAELTARTAALALWRTILPRPEIATRERLMELIQECCEASQLQMKWLCGGWYRPPPVPPTCGVQEVELTLGPFGGTFEQVVEFFRRLDHQPSFVRVNSFRLMEVRPWLDYEGRVRREVELHLSVSTFRAPGPP